MGLFHLLKSIFNVFCGPSERPPEPTPQHAQVQPTPPPAHVPVSQQARPPAHYHPPSSSLRPHKYEDQNQVNQQNEHYLSLRVQANEQGDRMAKCFEESQQAFSRGDGARAKELSNQGKAHKAKMEELNRQASEWIFVENNKDSRPGEVDLHGLYVKEAIAFTDRAIQEAKQRGDSEIHLVVGKGLHSHNGAAKIKPAIEDLMVKHQLKAALDPDNAGVLIVQLDAGGSRGIGADEITRRIERDDERCIIM